MSTSCTFTRAAKSRLQRGSAACGGPSADEIAAPIRGLLRRQRNAEVLMTEVTGVDVAGQRVQITAGPVAYDYLVLATGVRYTYFGHPEWQRHALSLKRWAGRLRWPTSGG